MGTIARMSNRCSRPHALSLLAVLVSIAGCAGELEAPMDGGAHADAAGADAAAGMDTGTPPDAAPSVDTGVPTDASEADGATTEDAATGTDAGTDAAVAMDAGAPGPGTTIAGCRIYPLDNAWNQDVRTLSHHPREAAIRAMMNPTRALHPDWGNRSVDHYGIPWSTGTGAPPLVMEWTTSYGATESDPLACTGSGGAFCYPIPMSAPIEGGSGAGTGDDRHVLYIDTAGAPDDCTLYELYNAQNFVPGGHWVASNGAIFHLGSNALRPEGWTSADAAGLPVLPGLVRVDEVLAGEITHAIRFTMQRTAQSYVHPATHAAGRTGTDLPPMGLRLRLRADYPLTGLTASGRVIVVAMQRYGLLLADNGSDWYVTGDSDDRWDAIIDDVIGDLGAIHGSDFEILDTGAFLPM